MIALVFTKNRWQQRILRVMRTMRSLWSTQEALWLEYGCSPRLEEALHWVPGPDGMRLAGSVLPVREE